MGGNVAWTIRLNDGTEYRMDRWTNIFPGIMMNDLFLSGEKTALDEALSSWIEMKSDWEMNKDSENWENTMTPVYAPYPFGLRPSEYGFFITDFQSKTIISCQHYTNPGRVFLHHWMHPEYEPNWAQKLSRSLSDNDDWFLEQEQRQKEERAELVKLFEERRALSYQIGALDGPIGEMTLDDLCRKVFSSGIVEPGEYVPLGTINIQPHDGWTLKTYSTDTSDERREAFEAVKSLGFELSKSEISDFEKWISYPDQED